MTRSDASEDKNPESTEQENTEEENSEQENTEEENSDPETLEWTPAAISPDPPSAAASEDEGEGGDPDFDSRVLCPNGECVGVIGPGGKCKVCGTTSEEDLPKAASTTSEDAAAPEPPAAAPIPVEKHTEDAAPPDFASRKLCSDGECIGIIGADGSCKECGKPFTGEA